jgi:hypothetical protein
VPMIPKIDLDDNSISGQIIGSGWPATAPLSSRQEAPRGGGGRGFSYESPVCWPTYSIFHLLISLLFCPLTWLPS